MGVIGGLRVGIERGHLRVAAFERRKKALLDDHPESPGRRVDP
jgi:hypothetical protein